MESENGRETFAARCGVQTYQSISRFHENHIPPVRLPLPSVIASAPAHLFFGTALGGHQILERPGRCRGQKKAWIQEVEQSRREILPRFLIRAGAGRPLRCRCGDRLAGASDCDGLHFHLGQYKWQKRRPKRWCGALADGVWVCICVTVCFADRHKAGLCLVPAVEPCNVGQVCSK